MVGERTKLLFVCGSLVGGGAEKILAYLVNHFARHSYEVRLVILERKLDYLREIDATVRLDCLDKTSRWGMLKALFNLRGILRAYRPRVVIGVLNHVNIVTMLAKMLSGTRPRVILCEHLYLHDYFPANVFGQVKKALMRFTFNHADAIVCVSAGMKANLVGDYGIDPERIQVIYNPIPIAEIVEKSQAEVHHPFFENGKYRVVISVGRLVKQKRFDRLLRAFARAKEERPDLRLLILGKGELEQELKLLARELRLEGEVDFVGFQDKPSAWMAKADMFAMSSEREGFPNVLIEAMACGLPIISTDCLSGPNEIIEQGQSGFLVPEEEPEALTKALLTLAADANLRRKFSAAGRRFAENFQIAKVLPAYEKLFELPLPASAGGDTGRKSK